MLSIGLATGVVLYYCFADHLIPNGVPAGAILRSPWASFPIAFGVNVYLFEGFNFLFSKKKKKKGLFFCVSQQKVC